MEMNTRLQVEHPVTEMITGLDLVEWQLRVAAGEKLPRTQDQLAINGHAVEVRLYAEDPVKGFLPSIGRLARLKLPAPDAHVRVDAGVAEGGEVSMFYDPMIAKVIAWDQTRTSAVARLANALETAEVAGVKTNLAFLIAALRHEAFIAGAIDTGFIDRHKESLIGAASPGPADAVLFAALFVLLERRAKAVGASPWRHLDGWRIGGVRQEEMLRLTEGESDRVVGVLYRDKGWRLSLDGKALDTDAVFDTDESISASLNGRRAQARVLRVSGNLVVLMQGQTYSFEPHDPLEASEHTHVAGKELRAPMPGKVVQIMTKPGERVRKGQALAIIEAMKMEHTLAAPGDLTVKDTPFRAGDQVGEGAVVVGFE
jgi:3-methylcrotonyl-CoA carboxylase alpha subunit